MPENNYMMNRQNFQQIKADFVTKEIGNELMLVPLSSNVSKMNELFTMNETGKFIWENLNGGMDMEALILNMSETFDVAPDQVRQDILLFQEKLSQMLSCKL